MAQTKKTKKKKLSPSKKNNIITAIKEKIQESTGEKPIIEPNPKKIDLSAIRKEIEEETKGKKESKEKKEKKDYILTGVPGFDDLLEDGIPKGSSILVAGGAGSGKTIFCLQTLMHHVIEGKKCFYMSFEESEDKLLKHMKEFGWDAQKYIKSGNLVINRLSPFDITRNIEGMLEKEKGDLLIEIEPVILPDNFEPDLIVLDSLTAVASAFVGKEDSYRIYIEQLFRFFEKLKSTSFLITETKQIPEVFSTTGVEEFLADGVIVIYNIKRGDIRENAIEILKMRGESHKKRIVAMQVTDKGMKVYPQQEVFGGLETS
jgi:KaiC/GvpD/RAD55 family RecA-like ATPase